MDYRKRHETGRIWAGLFLLLAGATWFLHEQGLFVPDTLFNWHLFVVALGVFLGVARGFRGFGWVIITAIGAVGMAEDYYSTLRIEPFIWPVVIILVGFLLLFRRRRPREEDWEAKWRARKLRWKANERQWHAEETVYSDEKVDIAASFGTFRKKLLSKNLKGGYAMTFMGNMEIDLMDANFVGTIRLDITQIMGATTIVVPEHWEVRPDVHAVFSDFKDRRPQPAMRNPEKVLVLSGKSIFGSIEVRTRVASSGE